MATGNQDKGISAISKKQNVKSKAPEESDKKGTIKTPPIEQAVEHIVRIKLTELYPFEHHPFSVKDDAEMEALVSSIKSMGVNQPAIVCPREEGGYTLISGHRRKRACEIAGLIDLPCIIRNFDHDDAITQMVESNTTSRDIIPPSERAKALEMHLNAIKHQGTNSKNVKDIRPEDVGKRSNQIVAERNKMTVRQVQRYIRLNELIPELTKMVDDHVLSLNPAVELSYIKPENQRDIANAIEASQSYPSLAQAKKMRQLDADSKLDSGMIDMIMTEDKKKDNEEKIIFSAEELERYFKANTSPDEMKRVIFKLLDEQIKNT